MMTKLKKTLITTSLAFALFLPYALTATTYALLPGDGGTGRSSGSSSTGGTGSSSSPSTSPGSSTTSTSSSATSTNSANNTACKKGDLFGVIPPWYKYLNFDSDCSPNLDLGNHPEQFWLIGFGVIEILLRVAGAVAVGFVIYAGFKFVMSQGDPENVKNARNAIINALIGLAIAILASTLVTFIAESFF